MTHTAYPLTIFYDQSCPLCTREVALLREFDANGSLRFVDCSPAEFVGLEGHSRAAMMQFIHARDAAGRWLVGAPVFAAAYGVCDLRLFAKLWGARWLQPMWRVAYPLIANNRRILSRLGGLSLLDHFVRWEARRAARRRCAINPPSPHSPSVTRSNPGANQRRC